MNPEEYLGVVADKSRFGALVNLPRQISWKLLRPQFAALVLRNHKLETEMNALRKDLLATNYRIDWLESRLDAQATGETPTGTPHAVQPGSSS